MLSKETLAIRVYDDLDAKQPGANFSGKTVADFQKACGVEFKDIDDLNIHLIVNGFRFQRSTSTVTPCGQRRRSP